jgi:NTP pyrophosphatase (non-canonical NTP hydrolase)
MSFPAGVSIDWVDRWPDYIRLYPYIRNKKTMSDIKEIIDLLVQFRDDRNWRQFHTTKDLSLAISIEAAELNELFLWKSTEECEKVDKAKISEELADIFAFAFLLADKHGFDVKEIVSEKVKLNKLKYPVEKSRNTAAKYTDL